MLNYDFASTMIFPFTTKGVVQDLSNSHHLGNKL